MAFSSPPPDRLKPGKRQAAPQIAADNRNSRPSSGGMTLKDVAALAGVSTMTVSRVINRPESVSPEVQKLVREAISRLDYVPNLLASGLATSRTRLVAAIVPTLANMTFAYTAQIAADRLSAEGYQVLLGLSGYPETVGEEELIRSILSRRPEALYLTGTFHSAATRRQLKAAKIPIVETWDLSRRPIDMAVGFSHRYVGQKVAEYLLSRRYQRFASIGGGDERALMRRDGFADALIAAGAPAPLSIVTPSPTSLPMGRETFGPIFDQGFRGAIFCSSDALALGVMLEAQKRGLAIPGEIGVIGFGDFDYAASTSPPLSSVLVDRRKVGLLAAEALLARLDGRKVSPKTVDVGFEILERATT